LAHAEERIDFLKPGEPLLCALDCQNPMDPNAVIFRVEKPRHQILGFLFIFVRKYSKCTTWKSLSR
jgi:hypothetical protein